MISIVEGITRKLQRNAQWVKTVADLADVKEGLIVKPAANVGGDVAVTDGVDHTNSLLYMVLTNGNRGDVAIAGLTVIGGSESFTCVINNEVTYARSDATYTSIFSEDGLSVLVAVGDKLIFRDEKFQRATAGQTPAEKVQFIVERVNGLEVTLAYASGGFGTV